MTGYLSAGQASGPTPFTKKQRLADGGYGAGSQFREYSAELQFFSFRYTSGQKTLRQFMKYRRLIVCLYSVRINECIKMSPQKRFARKVLLQRINVMWVYFWGKEHVMSLPLNLKNRRIPAAAATPPGKKNSKSGLSGLRFAQATLAVLPLSTLITWMLYVSPQACS